MRVRGLVLVGGLSERMGMDKSLLDYHGLPQREHVARLLRPFCDEVRLSCRPGQAIDSEFPLLPDAYHKGGPLAALLTAFDAAPDSAWLVVACDLPLIDGEVLRELMEGRDPAKAATAFRNVVMDFPEPLVTLWEPAAGALLRERIDTLACPRDLLMEAEIQLLEPRHPEKLLNANRPDEYERIRRELDSRGEDGGAGGSRRCGS